MLEGRRNKCKVEGKEKRGRKRGKGEREGKGER